MSNNCKVKGLLRGLRFISQIFDNDKEEEIEIGHPTDVKHVAHIGWQGPSESSPSWMNEFKSVPGMSSSAPLHTNGEIHSNGPDDSVKWVSQDSVRRGSRSVNSQGQQERDLPELPKSSRRQVMGNMRESHAKERSDRPRQHKKSSKHSQQQPKDTTTTCNGSKSIEQTMAADVTDSLQHQGSDLHPRTLPEKPRRSRSNRTKDGSSGGGSGSSRSRSRAQPMDLNLDQEHPSRLSSKSRNKHRSFEEEEQDDGPLQRGSSKQLLTN